MSHRMGNSEEFDKVWHKRRAKSKAQRVARRKNRRKK